MTRTAPLAAAAAALATSAILAQQPPPATPVVPPPMPPLLVNYKAVTADRLKQPADDEWLMIRRTYNGWGYSPLDKINAKNVGRLEPVWSFATGMERGHEATPLVSNGVMFVSTPGNQVVALDA